MDSSHPVSQNRNSDDSPQRSSDVSTDHTSADSQMPPAQSENQKSKKLFKFRHLSDRFLIFVCFALIGLITAIFWFDNERDKLNQYSAYTLQSASDNIQATIVSMYSLSGIVDKDNPSKVYFPELRIYIPDHAARHFRYIYIAPSNEDKYSAATYSTPYILNRPYADLSCKQMSAGIAVNKNTNDIWQYSEQDGSKKLADGRTLYFYKNPKCSNERAEHQELLSLLKKAESY